MQLERLSLTATSLLCLFFLFFLPQRWVRRAPAPCKSVKRVSRKRSRTKACLFDFAPSPSFWEILPRGQQKKSRTPAIFYVWKCWYPYYNGVTLLLTSQLTFALGSSTRIFRKFCTFANGLPWGPRWRYQRLTPLRHPRLTFYQGNCS